MLGTADKDFGELVFRRGGATFGVILVRLVGAAPEEAAGVVLDAVRAPGETLTGAFVVVSRRYVRVRRL